MKKGDKVRCISTVDDIDVTAGEVYKVVGVRGDVCAELNQMLDGDAFNFIDDGGHIRYDVFPASSYNQWEIVE